jgi:polysaccharide pyruvyl transferase CsaB
MRAIISGYYGFGNGGDEALLLSLLQMLPAHVQPIVLSQTPHLTAQTYQVESISRWDLLALQQCFRSSQAFIWGGGSLLQDRTSWRSPLYYLALMSWAQQLGLKTIAWAQGVGPLQRTWIRQWVQGRLRACTAVSVRDQPALDLLQSWGIAASLAPDPVWALPPEGLPQWEAWPSPRIAVVLRSHPQLTADRLSILTKALQNLQQQTLAHVLLIPFQIKTGSDPASDADVQIALQIHRQLPTASQMVLLHNPRQLQGVFHGVDLTITMRYHGLVMAAAAGSRCFGLSYDPKVQSLLQTLDMPGWQLTAIPTDPQQVYQQWLDCYQHGNRLSPVQQISWANQARRHASLLQATLI